MQRDKAALEFHGRPQLDWAYELLARHCERVFVSVRADQRVDAVRAGYPQIVDAHSGRRADRRHRRCAGRAPAGGVAGARLRPALRRRRRACAARRGTARRAADHCLSQHARWPARAAVRGLRARVGRRRARGDRRRPQLPAQARDRERRAAPRAGDPRCSATSTRRRNSRPRTGRSPTGRAHEIDRSPLLRDPARPGRPALRAGRDGCGDGGGALRRARRPARACARTRRPCASRSTRNSATGSSRSPSGDRVVFIPPVAGG